MVQDLLMGIKKSHYHYVMTMSESQITDYKLRRGLHICKEKHHGTINSKFMKELMLKGYATELTAAAENGKCWIYITMEFITKTNLIRYAKSLTFKCRISKDID